MVQLSVKELRNDYERAKRANLLDHPSFKRGVHIANITVNEDGSEKLHISRGSKDALFKMLKFYVTEHDCSYSTVIKDL